MARKTVGETTKLGQELIGALEEAVEGETKAALIEYASPLDADMAVLEKDVQRAYDESITLEEAERLAAKVLTVQLKIARELAVMDLNSRMRKNGLKAKRAEAYMAECNKSEKKPAEGYLDNVITLDAGVKEAQANFDETDSRKESLAIYLGIFKDAHIYFRGIAKGRFE
jgi:hypothetical protein